MTQSRGNQEATNDAIHDAIHDAIRTYSPAHSSRKERPSFLRTPLKMTERAGIFTPIANVSVAKSTLRRLREKSISTISRTRGSIPEWCTPTPHSSSSFARTCRPKPCGGHSMAIRGHQRPSVVYQLWKRALLRPNALEAIRGNQRQSEAIRGVPAVEASAPQAEYARGTRRRRCPPRRSRPRYLADGVGPRAQMRSHRSVPLKRRRPPLVMSGNQRQSGAISGNHRSVPLKRRRPPLVMSGNQRQSGAIRGNHRGVPLRRRRPPLVMSGNQWQSVAIIAACL